MNPIQVEIGQFRIIDKGCLKAFFSLLIYPQGQKIVDCRYFIKGENRWFNFPEKEVTFKDGRKSEYVPYISYLNKEYLDALKIAVLEALKDAKPSEKYGQKNQSYQRKENPLPAEASPDWGEPPF